MWIAKWTMSAPPRGRLNAVAALLCHTQWTKLHQGFIAISAILTFWLLFSLLRSGSPLKARAVQCGEAHSRLGTHSNSVREWNQRKKVEAIEREGWKGWKLDWSGSFWPISVVVNGAALNQKVKENTCSSFNTHFALCQVQRKRF